MKGNSGNHCLVEGCAGSWEALRLCSRHLYDWDDSFERKRALAWGLTLNSNANNPQIMQAFLDWVRRVEAEERNTLLNFKLWPERCYQLGSLLPSGGDFSREYAPAPSKPRTVSAKAHDCPGGMGGCKSSECDR